MTILKLQLTLGREFSLLGIIMRSDRVQTQQFIEAFYLVGAFYIVRSCGFSPRSPDDVYVLLYIKWSENSCHTWLFPQRFFLPYNIFCCY